MSEENEKKIKNLLQSMAISPLYIKLIRQVRQANSESDIMISEIEPITSEIKKTTKDSFKN